MANEVTLTAKEANSLGIIKDAGESDDDPHRGRDPSLERTADVPDHCVNNLT